MISLRPYQQTGVENIRGRFGAGDRAVLYVLSTGGGKTFTFSYIAASAANLGNRVLILVHRTELLQQSSLSLAAIGVEHGLIAPAKKAKAIAGEHFDTLGRSYIDQQATVFVASVQTIARQLDKWAHLFKLVIIDEAHHATAGQWARTIEACSNARVLGVTATPVRTDGQGLGREAGGVFDSLVEGPSITELIKLGYLVRPQVFAPPAQFDLKGIRKTAGGDYNQKQLAERMDTPTITGDAVAHYQRYLGGKSAIAFCASIAHAEHTAEAMRQAGVRAAAVSGKTPDEERRRMIADLGAGKLDVLSSCDIVSEGTDIPSVTGALLLRPTQSEGLFLQQVGRVLRPAEGKDRAIILDHVGNCLTHGLPDEERPWTLDGREKNERGPRDEEPDINVQQCPTCYSVHAPAPSCPACGHVYTPEERQIKQVDGELAEVTEAQRETLRQRRRLEVGKARTQDEFERIAAERGYSAGWVHKMMEIRRNQRRAA